MKAMVLEKFGAALELKEVTVPKPGPNEALIKVGACGIGLTVVSMIATPGRVTSYPRIPGHEIAGTIVEVGAEVVRVLGNLEASSAGRLSKLAS